MKYQIIFDHNVLVPDDEFRAIVEAAFAGSPIFKKVKLIEARSLEGVRPEVWQREDVDDLSDIL